MNRKREKCYQKAITIMDIIELDDKRNQTISFGVEWSKRGLFCIQVEYTIGQLYTHTHTVQPLQIDGVNIKHLCSPSTAAFMLHFDVALFVPNEKNLIADCVWMFFG